jgi:tripartite-type tricarboxylate transporter receptor subunit TctC
MSNSTAKMVRLIAITMVCLMVAGPVVAEEFPSKPIDLIVPWNPGGSADLTARIVATIAPKYFPVPITVHNKAGGGGALATRHVAKAKADGYTVLAGYGGGEHISTPHVRKVPFDTFKDFIPICMIANVPIVVTVKADSPFKTAKDLVDYAKKNPGTIKYGASGIGSTTDLTMIMLGYKTEVKFTSVPFKGGSPTMAALVGGHIDVASTGLSGAAALIESGKVRAIGLSAPKRSVNFKDIPTFIEQGYNVEVISPKGLAVPAGTPPEVVATLGELFGKVMKDKKTISLLSSVGLEPGYQPAKEFGATIRRYYDEYGAALDSMGLKIK